MKSIQQYINEGLKLGKGSRIPSIDDYNIIKPERAVSELNEYSGAQVHNADDALMDFLTEFWSVGIKCAKLFYSGNAGYSLYLSEEPDDDTKIGYIMYQHSDFSAKCYWYFQKNIHYKGDLNEQTLDKMLKWKKNKY